jgi:hypothetical protein
MLCYLAMATTTCSTESTNRSIDDSGSEHTTDATSSLDSNMPPATPKPDSSFSMDASPDEKVETAEAGDAFIDLCPALNERRLTLIKQASCAAKEECALIGNCGSAEWDAVSKSDEAEALRLREEMDTKRCIWAFDGPIPHVECVERLCKVVQDTDSEGYPLGPWCGGQSGKDDAGLNST